MKKNLLFVAMIGLVLTTLSGCGNKITVKGADGTEYNSYQECCSAQDFEAAHKFLAAMKEKESPDYSEAREYVFNQEALFLISMNDEASTKRLFFLLHEDANEVDDKVRDTRCNTIIELAIKQNNQALVEQTVGMYNSIINSSLLRKIYDYLYKGGRVTDTNIIMNILFRNKGIDLLTEDAISSQDDDLLIKILEQSGPSDLSSTKKIVEYFVKKNNKRQIANIKEMLNKNMQWEALTEFALATNNLALMKQSYQKSENQNELFNSMMQHAVKSKSISEMQCLLPLVTTSSQAKILIEKCMEADIPDAVTTLTKKYGAQLSQSFKDKIMKYALSKNGKEFTDLVISILNSTPIEGHPLPAGQRMTSNRPEEVVNSHNQYVESVKSFNSKCDDILSSAISQHKSQLANKVLTLYKDVPNEYIVNEHWYQIANTCTYSKDDKERAQEQVKEAKKRGDI